MTKAQLIAKIERMELREIRYRALLDDSSDPIFSFNRDGKYLYVNRQFTSGLDGGVIPDEVIGKTIWDLFPEDEAEKRFAIVKWVFENGESRNIEVRVPKAGGDTYHLTTVKPIFDEDNEVAYVICIAKEITERKKFEAELKNRTVELEQALQEVRDLQGIVPICSYCKKTRNDEGYWNSVESYISKHTGAELSHGVCPDCLPNLYEEAGLEPPENR
jgi:PAS domain S-box-containing protein